MKITRKILQKLITEQVNAKILGEGDPKMFNDDGTINLPKDKEDKEDKVKEKKDKKDKVKKKKPKKEIQTENEQMLAIMADMLDPPSDGHMALKPSVGDYHDGGLGDEEHSGGCGGKPKKSLKIKISRTSLSKTLQETIKQKILNILNEDEPPEGSDEPEDCTGLSGEDKEACEARNEDLKEPPVKPKDSA